MLDSRRDPFPFPPVRRARARRVLDADAGGERGVLVAHRPWMGDAVAGDLSPGLSRNPVALPAAVRGPDADLRPLHGDLRRSDHWGSPVPPDSGDARDDGPDRRRAGGATDGN